MLEKIMWQIPQQILGNGLWAWYPEAGGTSRTYVPWLTPTIHCFSHNQVDQQNNLVDLMDLGPIIRLEVIFRGEPIILLYTCNAVLHKTSVIQISWLPKSFSYRGIKAILGFISTAPSACWTEPELLHLLEAIFIWEISLPINTASERVIPPWIPLWVRSESGDSGASQQLVSLHGPSTHFWCPRCFHSYDIWTRCSRI